MEMDKRIIRDFCNHINFRSIWTIINSFYNKILTIVISFIVIIIIIIITMTIVVVTKINILTDRR